MNSKSASYDVVVAGGGLAGFSAAVAAAREGARTALVQDRPVLGGNSSSEIRVTPHGAGRFHAYARETGIITEVTCEDRANNHEQFHNNGWTNSVWDMTLYDLAMRTPNLTVYLNTSVQQVEKDGDRRIAAVTARVAGAETELRLQGRVFIDCTGDGTVAALAGNEWRMGSESRDEFGEPHAPERASGDTMGSSIHFRARDTGRPAPFRAPEWAVAYDDPAFFYAHNRRPYDIRAGYWWFELGSPWDTIHDAETIRHELTRHVLGVWDWIKNKDPLTRDKAVNYALDWIGQVPGKRESRRIMGRYLLTEHDVLEGRKFADEVAYGGWYLDLHIPGGLLAPTSELPGAAELVSPYGIPLRILIAKDIDNLLMAGRNVSVTHAALGTVRVMSTTAIMGQAAGTAAAVALRRGIPVPDVPGTDAIAEVQQTLLRAGCFLPGAANVDPLDLARQAEVTASSEAELAETEPGDEGEALDIRRSQWVAVAAGELEHLDVWVANRGDHPLSFEAELHRTGHIWDYDVRQQNRLAAAILEVPPACEGWIRWLPRLDARSGLPEEGYVRLDLLNGRGLIWRRANAVHPGLPSASELEPGRLRSHDDGRTMSFRVSPPQPIYSAAQTVSGVTRPHRTVNLWRSAPGLPLPQTLELRWRETREIGTVELTFPGHLLQDHNRYPAYYREPDCPRDYRIEAWTAGGWESVHETFGNYQRRVSHRLSRPVRTERIRIVFLASNGGAEAAVYEIRCYGI
ncbi:FAD-dependent oxidoreductase [Paenibacillus urinalis]|uniref:FAD-dependent oxidoreductase n=1 Tax=Paenibacillus urinalis TaxID=521520 RepID=A0AAX3N6M7_9BACL|nr:FAD-dependent oxidoreductase [Paenibacillus urinalis]WDH85302.1 FAD-dependent oxidoreductase [Paenibacillus urinalis]WDH98398.1 FAD-dependent oxidoreductase [Paenibacillus urinalis]WDI02088.1 FAD-dependent oxidoreductase [Paenibacillus urinalis]